MLKKNNIDKKYLLIVNPKSGTKKYKHNLNKVKKYFLKYKMNLEVILTEYKGHATEIAKNASKADKYDVIIGAGGDGTINEVLSGMIGSSKPMAIIPWGTGNVFAREMNIPKKTKRICKIIRKENIAKIDVGRCNKKYFFLMCSAGFDAYSIKQTEMTNLKRFFGGLSYLIGGIRAFTKYDYPEIQIELDNGIKDKGTLVLISNTSKYAIYFTITPKANPVDGLLDVYVFKEAGGWSLLKFIAWIVLSIFSNNFRKNIKKNKGIFFIKHAIYRSKNVKLFSNSRVLTQIDGDLSEELPVEIKIIHHAINFILPSKIVKKYKKLK